MEWLGWSALILLLIPLALLVRLFVRRSRWSILRITIVSVVGVALASLWLHFTERLPGGEPLSMGGKLGLLLAEWLQGKTGGIRNAFFISSGLMVIWIILAGLDAIVASARFFINKPYIKEIIKEKIVEVEKTVERKPRPAPQPKSMKPEKKVKLAPKPAAPRSDDDVPDFHTPGLGILKDRSAEKKTVSKAEIEHNISIIRETLADHHV